MAFTQDTFDYLGALAAHNSKDWFEDHRDQYEAHWKAPALDFIAAISAQMAALEPTLRAEPKLNGSLRRINRDVRFSKDKSPYNARLHMIFWAGDHPNRAPGMHFVLSPEGVGYGAGQWGIQPGALAAMRARIVGADGQALIDALDQAEAVGCTMDDPDLARLPKGFEAEGRQAELLRYKGFVARTHENLAPASQIIGAGAQDWAVGVTQALMPLIRWLAA